MTHNITSLPITDKERVKQIAKDVAPFAAAFLVGVWLGRRSVKIPPKVTPSTLHWIGDGYVQLTMSDGTDWCTDLPMIGTRN